MVTFSIADTSYPGTKEGFQNYLRRPALAADSVPGPVKVSLYGTFHQVANFTALLAKGASRLPIRIVVPNLWQSRRLGDESSAVAAFNRNASPHTVAPALEDHYVCAITLSPAELERAVAEAMLRRVAACAHWAERYTDIRLTSDAALTTRTWDEITLHHRRGITQA